MVVDFENVAYRRRAPARHDAAVDPRQRPSSLAASAAAAVALGREVGSAVALAGQVQRLTLDAMSTQLATLDLTRCALLLRGARAPVDRAYAAIGLQPRAIAD